MKNQLDREMRRKERLAASVQLAELPDFSEPRRRRRAETVLDFAYDLRLAPHGTRAMKATEFYKIIGTKGRSTAIYFATLFRQVGAYGARAGDGDALKSTYKYQAVPHRVSRLANAVEYTNGLVKAAGRKGWSFLTHPGPRSELPRTGDRVYPWWALMPSDARHELFVAEHGQGFDYDIEAAKPTVTLQAWQRLMKAHKPAAPKSAECKLPMWTELVKNRTAFRKRLADEVEISVEQAKGVCQTVLNGGWAAPVPSNGICELIGRDATLRLMENATYKALRTDFQVFWRELKNLNELAGLDLIAMGESQGQSISTFYNRIEDEVMTVVAEELKSWDVWFIHDGFMTKDRIPKAEVEKSIFLRTGYQVKLEEADLCKSAGPS